MENTNLFGNNPDVVYNIATKLAARIISSENRIKILNFRRSQLLRKYPDGKISHECVVSKNIYYDVSYKSALDNPIFEQDGSVIEFDINDSTHVYSLEELILDSLLIYEDLIKFRELTDEMINYIIKIYNLDLPRDSDGMPLVGEMVLRDRVNNLLNKRIAIAMGTTRCANVIL